MITLQHGFEAVDLDLTEEKSKNLLTLIKKYKDNLGLGLNLDKMIITSSDSQDLINPSTTDVTDLVTYVINVKHDGKG